MNPYQDQRNQTAQPLIGSDAYYQQYLAPQSEPSNQNIDMYAPAANPTEKQVYQPYSPYTETQYQQQPQPQPQPQIYTQYQVQPPPQQIIIQQQTQYMVQTTMPNPVPSSVFISGLPCQANGRKSQPFFCQHCGKAQVSDTRYVLGNGGLLLCCGLCIGGCFICALFPFCTEDCQDAIHSCPECQQTVGRNNFCS